jgi:hypothetical protein
MAKFSEALCQTGLELMAILEVLGTEYIIIMIYTLEFRFVICCANKHNESERDGALATHTTPLFGGAILILYTQRTVYEAVAHI